MSIGQLRSRIIRPDYFTSERLTNLGDKAMIVYAGLWVIADREGRLEDSPKLIRAFTRPFDDECDCDVILQSLNGSGFIHRYSVGGLKYIQICNWKEMQRVHPKERVSRIPPPPALAETADPSVRHEPSMNQTSSVHKPYPEEEEEVVREVGVEVAEEEEAQGDDYLPWDERDRLRAQGERQ